jgi:hypothetical protein
MNKREEGEKQLWIFLTDANRCRDEPFRFGKCIGSIKYVAQAICDDILI